MDEDIPPAHAASSSSAGGAQHPTATATASTSFSSSSGGAQPGTATATGSTSNGSSAPIPPSSGFAVSLNAGSASGSSAGGAGAASRPAVSNLERAKVTSPTFERSNPLSMRVARPGAGAGALAGSSSRSRRGASAEGAAAAGMADVQQQPEGSSGSASASTSTSTAKGKGPAAASEQDTAMVPVVEPKEAIRQQFHVRRRPPYPPPSGTPFDSPVPLTSLCPGTFTYPGLQRSQADSQYPHPQQ